MVRIVASDQAGYCLHKPLRELIAGLVHFASGIDDGRRDRLEEIAAERRRRARR